MPHWTSLRSPSISARSGGSINIHMRTTEPVACSALTGSGAPVTPENAIFKWAPKGTENSMGLVNIPLTEKPVAITGSVNMGTSPFSRRHDLWHGDADVHR